MLAALPERTPSPPVRWQRVLLYVLVLAQCSLVVDTQSPLKDASPVLDRPPSSLVPSHGASPAAPAALGWEALGRRLQRLAAVRDGPLALSKEQRQVLGRLMVGLPGTGEDAHPERLLAPLLESLSPIQRRFLAVEPEPPEKLR